MGQAEVFTKAITLRHPWAFAIAHLEKRIENRDWRPPEQLLGQRIAIHGGAIPKGAALEDCAGQARFIAGEILTPEYLKALPEDKRRFLLSLMPLKLSHWITLGIVATAVLSKIVTDEDKPWTEHGRWYFGPFGWVLDDVVTLPVPVPCKGAQGLWTLPTEVEAAVLR